jgi:hypothetical protein
VATGVAEHLEAGGVAEDGLVAVGGIGQQQDERFGGDRDPGELRVTERVADHELDRRVVAQQFLHGLPGEFGTLPQDGELAGMAQQRQHAAADQAAKGLVQRSGGHSAGLHALPWPFGATPRRGRWPCRP